MYGQYRKLNLKKILLLKCQGLSNVQIAQRLGVTQGAVYNLLRKRNTMLSTDNNDAYIMHESYSLKPKFL